MIFRGGKRGNHEYGVISRVPDHQKKRLRCQQCMQKYREPICGVFTLIILFTLHWNSNIESKFDALHMLTCSESSHVCSLVYGCFESIIFALILCAIYYGFFYLYFRIRYHFVLSDILSGFDAYIIALPWLLSPLLKWHSVTSLIIDAAQLFDSVFIYQYPMESVSNIITGNNRLLLQEMINIENDVLNEVSAEIDNNSSSLIEIEPQSTPSYELAAYPILVAAFIRTLWSFILWNGLDQYLWSNKSLNWLFESGPNKAIISLKSEHQRMINQQLLPHLDYISDITRIILQYVDEDAPLVLLDIKQSLSDSLKHTNLTNAYKWFSVITATMSAYRLWYCPSVGYIFAPVLFVIGVIIFVAIIITAIANGDAGSLNCHGIDYQFFIVFGVFGSALCWGLFIWWCMQKRLETLKNIQESASENNAFEYRLARTVYNL